MQGKEPIELTTTTPSLNSSETALRATIAELLTPARSTTTDRYLGESLKHDQD